MLEIIISNDDLIMLKDDYFNDVGYNALNRILAKYSLIQYKVRFVENETARLKKVKGTYTGNFLEDFREIIFEELSKSEREDYMEVELLLIK